MLVGFKQHKVSKPHRGDILKKAVCEINTCPPLWSLIKIMKLFLLTYRHYEAKNNFTNGFNKFDNESKFWFLLH